MLGLIDSRSAALVRAVAIEGKSAEAAGEPMGLSALPLLAGLRLMRRGAPTRPGLSGALLG
ncbi:MAG: DUF1109 domain-containing protein, partial [Rhodobacterales bacterium]|nr:DUF1109 domain-containing protein [Rhodobacterales bacterium]